MKKLLFILSCILLTATTVNAQQFTKATQADIDQHFFATPEVQAFTQNDITKRPRIKIVIIINCCGGVVNLRISNPVLDPSSGIYKGTNAVGKEELMQVTYTGIDDITKKEVSLSMVKNLITNQVMVWAEDDTHQYKAVKAASGKYEINKTPTNLKSFSSNITGCFNQFKKANGPSSCSSCISCVQNCSSKKTKWQKIACAVSNCGGSCWSCVTSVYNFVACVFN